jgi:transcription antitermination protein NusB
MLNRRILRIKVLEILYASFKKEESLSKAEKELLFSIEKIEELFLMLMLLLDDITHHAKKVMEIRKEKRFASEEERHPNMRFVENRVTKLICSNPLFKKKINEKKISWTKYPELIRGLYQTLESSEVFDIYMNKKTDSFRNDKRIAIFLFSDILYNSEELYSCLEEQSIYWNGDVDYILTKITHIIDNINKEQPEAFVLPGMFKQDDDRVFVIDLLRNTLVHIKEYSEIIDLNVVNWDIERISDTDRMILLTAVSEIVKLPSIPVKVTFNEYIELAKLFGSEKSGSFINGILDKIIKYMAENNLFKKTGRGLIDN